MADIIYIKYNRTRKEEFQIKTSILSEAGVVWVEKTALTEAGKDHIRSFDWKYEKLKQQHQYLQPVKPEISEDGKTARFPYLEGKTLAEVLGEEIVGGKAPVEAIREVMGKICSVFPEYEKPFAITEELKQVFGETPKFQDTALAVSNIDALMENILVTPEGWYFLDYEWVYDFPVPLHFVQYRILFYFYRKYHSLMKYNSMEEFLSEFGIHEELLEAYGDMEESFQRYVHGNNQELYLLNYRKDYKEMADLEEEHREFQKAKEKLERLSELEFELENTATELKKLKEVHRLTENHVANLDVIIGDLRRENGEMAQAIGILNSHVSFPYRVRRKLGAIVNRKFPKGTKERKILSYCKNTLRHPVRYIGLYTSEDGRNRIHGHFTIGDEYFTHGMVHLPKEEHPLVSIVIPVYNQIHYTYACLCSIEEHTKDVPYEVIIADDVSTDATAELSRYVENAVICRNKENQGFLGNCNQAAEAARGKYILFLNNDTQVTEGWLSSLVNLIESDPSIGMVGSKLVYPDGRLQEAGGIIWSDGSGWNYGRMDDPDKPEYNYVKDVDYISGASIMLPVSLWKQIGGFDKRYAPAYCEDADLAFEVRKAGYRVVYQPLSKVIHFEGISNGTDVNGTGLKRYQVENSKKMREKWAEEFKNQYENTGNPDPFRARERSRGKQIILVVDHYVPTFDKDAGSKCTFQYMKMFVEKGFVVKFLGDNYAHEEPYTTALEQLGIEVLYGDEYRTGIWDWLEKHGKDIAFVYLNRPHIAVKYIDFIRSHTDIKILYFGHDLHFLRETREYEITGDEEIKKSADYWRSVELSLMKKTDMAYYPSYVERDLIHDINPKIRVKDIPLYVYETFKESLDLDFEKKEGLLFVGGFGHPPNADAVLWFVKEVFPKIREKLAVNFYIVGSRVTDEIKALEQPGNGVVVKGFVSDEELEELYRKCRIVVVPLRYGAGIKGKVLEAMYNGAVVVTTSIGAEGIKEASDVLTVRDEADEFAEAVMELYDAPDKCRQISENTQIYMKEHFSLDAVWNCLKEDFTR